MAHARKNIRDAAAQLLAGLSQTGARVYPSRYYPVDEASLPAICIYTISEESDADSMGPRNLVRRLQLAVEIVARAVDTLDDTLDEIAAEVEAAIGANPTLNGSAKDCILGGTRIGLSSPSDPAAKPTGSAVLSYLVTYRTLAANSALIS